MLPMELMSITLKNIKAGFLDPWQESSTLYKAVRGRSLATVRLDLTIDLVQLISSMVTELIGAVN